MFCQLGNIVFDGLFSPTTFTTDGDEAVYAVHELIGSKPHIQKTGDELQKLTFEIKLRAEFCNPANSIASLKAAKDAGTVMPLLLGNGKYVNDYVIISLPYEIIQTFSDGTIIEAKVTLTIWEYVSVNKQQSAMLSAKQAGFAIATQPVTTLPVQPVSPAMSIAQSATAASQQAALINQLVSGYNPASSTAAAVGAQILAAANQVQSVVTTINTQLNNARNIDNEYNSIRSTANNLSASAKAMAALYPFTSVASLTQANLLLQSNAGSFTTSTSGMMQLLIVRQPVAA